MRKVFAIGILMVLNQFVWAQQFSEKFSITLPDSIRSANVEWVDLDNDGLLDVLIPSRSQSNSYLLFAKGDTVAMPVLHANVLKIVDVDYYQVVDFNRDNAMDVVVSGAKNNLPITIVYLNNGDFTFDEQVLSVPAFSISRFVDLNDDAKVEWVISGENNGDGFVNIFKETAPGQWTLVHDSLKFTLTALETFDADGDGTHDLFISGRDGADSLFTGFLINHGAFYFKPYLAKPWEGSATVSDLNSDGTFDVVFSGKDEIGNKVNKIFQSQGSAFELKDEPLALQMLSVFTADMNSDGVVDYNYFGTTILNDSVNIIRYDTNDYDTLVSHKVSMQRFGDLEHDGDLDLVQVANESSIRLQFLENNAAVNSAPGQPTNGIALPVFNRLFMYWNRPSDDHTPVNSLTFDVALTSQGDELQGGEFDLFNAKRLGASHGNNRTQNFRLVKKPTVAFGYYIQAVDNSLHAGDDKLPAGGLCIGNGATPCDLTEAEQLVVCEDEIKTLTAPNESLWFSFADGYLGIHSTYDLQTSKGDTVFYFNPSVSVCDALKVWTVRVKNDTIKKEFNTVYACEGSTLEFKAETDWDEIQWTSEHKGDLGTASTIQYPVTQADSVFLDVSSESGCIISRRTAVLISKPVVEVSADRYKIMKGSEVQLTATGAERYTWIPATGLNQTNIPNPVASPVITTAYTVTGYDSLDCSAAATVTIVVEDTGFIPNLFTPNDDGTNDELKVYGLSAANDFSLRIYNREGSLVFKTDNVSDAAQQGWNGFTNGVRQPSGVYFWKVKGSLPSGEKLLLNGKESGSIVLVR